MLLGALSLIVLVSSTGLRAEADVRAQHAKAQLAKCTEGDFDCFIKWSVAIDEASGFKNLAAALQSEIDRRGETFDCHTTTHHIGDALILLKGLKAFETGAERLCLAGLYDGLFSGLGKIESEETIFSRTLDICSKLNLTSFACLHGLGHGAYFATGADLRKALAICDRLQDGIIARNCGMGVVMYIELENSTPDSPCAGMVSAAGAGCANIFAQVQIHHNVSREEACAVYSGYVRDDCNYGYGFWVSAMKVGPDVEGVELCADSAWCSRGWGWGARMNMGDESHRECTSQFSGSPLLLQACMVGSDQTFRHNSLLPDRPGPLRSDNVLDPIEPSHLLRPDGTVRE